MTDKPRQPNDQLPEHLLNREQGFRQWETDSFDDLPFKMGRFPTNRENLCDWESDLQHYTIYADLYLSKPTPRKSWWTVWLKVREWSSDHSHTYAAFLAGYLKAREGDSIENVGMYLTTKVIDETFFGPFKFRGYALSQYQTLRAILLSKWWQGLRPYHFKKHLNLDDSIDNYTVEQLRDIFLSQTNGTKD